MKTLALMREGVDTYFLTMTRLNLQKMRRRSISNPCQNINLIYYDNVSIRNPNTEITY